MFYLQHQITGQDQEEVARLQVDSTGPLSSIAHLPEVVLLQGARDTAKRARAAETEFHPTSSSPVGQGQPVTCWRMFGLFQLGLHCQRSINSIKEISHHSFAAGQWLRHRSGWSSFHRTTF